MFKRFIDLRESTFKYFRNNIKNISHDNLLILNCMGFFGFIITGLLLIISPILISGWHITQYHFLICGFFLLITIYTLIIRKLTISLIVQNFIVQISVVILMLLVILLCLVPFKNGDCNFIIFTMILISLLFTMSFIQIFIFDLLTIFLAIFLMNTYTSINLIGINTFYLIFGVLVSLIVNVITTILKVKEYNAKEVIINYSNMDGLTGIYNKNAFEDLSKDYIKLRNSSCSLIVMDIDDFKLVNDNNGHQIGDEVLQIVGECLYDTFRGSDILGRVGGDEFVIIMKDIDDVQIVKKKINSFNSNIRKMLKERNSINITCSFGGILANKEYRDYIELFKMADELLYHSKNSGKNKQIIMSAEEFKNLNLQTKKMLIIDDEESNEEILSNIFKKDFNITVRNNGREALDLLKVNNDFHIIILDIIMPEMDGYEFIKELKNDDDLNQIPIVVISSDADSELEMLRLGANDMIAKPIDPEITKQRIINVLTN